MAALRPKADFTTPPAPQRADTSETTATARTMENRHAQTPPCQTRAAVLVRVRGPDPHRRKVSHASFFGVQGGISTLTASGTLLCATADAEAKTAQVFVICSADVIAPFLPGVTGVASAVSECELVSGSSIDVLVEGDSSGAWWSCSLHALADLPDVDAAVTVLTQSSSDWELGWAKPLYPPPLVSHLPPLTHQAVGVQSFSGALAQAQSSFQYPNGRRRSAGLIALLKVQRLTSEVEAERLADRKMRPGSPPPPAPAAPAAASVWPAHYPTIKPSSFPTFPLHPWLPVSAGLARGTSVTVFSSPYGLLSPHIFHNTMTRGIVSNSVALDDRERLSPARGHFASHERASASSLADVPSTLLLLDARCFSGSEGAPVMVTSPDDTQQLAPLAAMITLPIRHTARGSSVELNLAIPMHRIHSFLLSKKLHVWNLLTNAHLVRPFLDLSTRPSSSDASLFFPATIESAPTPLLFDDAIRLKAHAKLSVRVESAHLQWEGAESPADIGWLDAHLVYVSQGPWDVALLKVSCGRPLFPIAVHPAFRFGSPSFAPHSPPPQCLPPVGSRALVIGHALFSPSCALRPTVTAGHLSKVVHLSTGTGPSLAHSPHTFPALLMTSAAVHNGNSGGLLIDEHTGFFLGMVTSNVMHTPVAPNHRPPVHVRRGSDSYADEERQSVLQQEYDEALKQAEEARQAQTVHMIIPHLNFSIPYTALLPLLDFAMGGAQDVSLLYLLESSPEVVERLWQLTDLHSEPIPQPPFSPKYTKLVEQMEKEQQGKHMPDVTASS